MGTMSNIEIDMWGFPICGGGVEMGLEKAWGICFKPSVIGEKVPK
jgi:hypothetical protein